MVDFSFKDVNWENYGKPTLVEWPECEKDTII